MFAQSKGLLGGGPKRDVIAFDVRHGRVRFHRKMLHPRKGESVFENMIGFFEPCFDVAFGVTEAVTKIGAGKFLGRFVALPHELAAACRRVVHQWRAGRQRFIEIRHRR